MNVTQMKINAFDNFSCTKATHQYATLDDRNSIRQAKRVTHALREAHFPFLWSAWKIISRRLLRILCSFFAVYGKPFTYLGIGIVEIWTLNKCMDNIMFFMVVICIIYWCFVHNLQLISLTHFYVWLKHELKFLKRSSNTVYSIHSSSFTDSRN